MAERRPGWNDFPEPPPTPVEYYAPKHYRPGERHHAVIRAAAVDKERHEIIACIQSTTWSGSQEIVEMIRRRIGK